MKSFLKSLFLMLICIAFSFKGYGRQTSKRHILWYDKPAANWNEALPIGNGFIHRNATHCRTSFLDAWRESGSIGSSGLFGFFGLSGSEHEIDEINQIDQINQLACL